MSNKVNKRKHTYKATEYTLETLPQILAVFKDGYGVPEYELMVFNTSILFTATEHTVGLYDTRTLTINITRENAAEVTAMLTEAAKPTITELQALVSHHESDDFVPYTHNNVKSSVRLAEWKIALRKAKIAAVTE